MPDIGFRRHEYAAGRDRVGVGVELAVAGGSGDVHGPVAGAAHVAGAALLDTLVSAALVRSGVFFRHVARTVVVAEFVIEAFGLEVALFLGHPFLQPEVRGNHEL